MYAAMVSSCRFENCTLLQFISPGWISFSTSLTKGKLNAYSYEKVVLVLHFRNWVSLSSESPGL